MAPALVNQLLRKDIKLRAAMSAFEDIQGRHYAAGTIVLPVGIQEVSRDRVHDLLQKYSREYGVQVHAMETGLTARGIDMGSQQLEPLRKPNILLAVGAGVSSYEAGEIWHLLDYIQDFHVTQVDVDRLGSIPLNTYNIIILPGGSYQLSQTLIGDWVKAGGTLIAMKGALRWLSKSDFAKIKIKSNHVDSIASISYAQLGDSKRAQRIPGSAFEATMDLSNPIAYGYRNPQIPLFRNHTLFLETSGNLQQHPIYYTSDPLLGGYASKANLEQLKGSPAISITSFGSGKVIAFTDDPTFRAFWIGTQGLFLNAILFGNLIDTR
jgi:hypothetical protein